MKLVISQLDKKAKYIKAYAHNPDGEISTLEYINGKVVQKGYTNPSLYYLFLELINDFFPGEDNEATGE